MKVHVADLWHGYQFEKSKLRYSTLQFWNEIVHYSPVKYSTVPPKAHWYF